jgi:hypothetical protein
VLQPGDPRARPQQPQVVGDAGQRGEGEPAEGFAALGFQVKNVTKTLKPLGTCSCPARQPRKQGSVGWSVALLDWQTVHALQLQGHGRTEAPAAAGSLQRTSGA